MEIMVGVVIGMLGIIVIMQVFSVFESQKRSTTSGSDIQNSGAIALFGLEQNIRQSGYDTATYNVAACNLLLPSGGTVTAAPIVINPATTMIPAGDANTDTLLVTYGNGTGSVEGDALATLQTTANVYPITTPTAFTVNDYVVSEAQTQPSPCNLTLDSVTATSASTITVQIGSTSGLLSAGAVIYDFGQAPKFQAYAIRSGKLTVCDYLVNNCGDATQVGNSTFWVPIADNIVSLRAQYGQDEHTTPHPPTNPNQTSYIVDTYDQVTPSTACYWARAPVVRLALVARNGQPNQSIVTSSVPTWEGSAGAPINLSATTVPTNFTWQNYRYKVFQTTTPLRNTVATEIVALGAGC